MSAVWADVGGLREEDEKGKTRRVSDWLLGSLITQTGTESRRALKQCHERWSLLTSTCLPISPPCITPFDKCQLQLIATSSSIAIIQHGDFLIFHESYIILINLAMEF